MKSGCAISLTFLLAAGASGPAVAIAPATATAAATVTVHRCTDARGHVTLQDDPCPRGSQDSTRQMTRPKDPPTTPRSRRTARAPAFAVMPDPPIARRELVPPPAMYRCMSYDGIERFSEQYDPNPRCEPYVLYYPYPNLLTPAQALSCRWVEDSCVRLSDRAACERWKAKKKEAASAVVRAFSDTAAYRKSELERATQVVEESCL